MRLPSSSTHASSGTPAPRPHGLRSPLIGFLAGQFGLPAALTTVSALGFAAAFVAYATRDA